MIALFDFMQEDQVHVFKRNDFFFGSIVTIVMTFDKYFSSVCHITVIFLDLLELHLCLSTTNTPVEDFLPI